MYGSDDYDSMNFLKGLVAFALFTWLFMFSDVRDYV